MMGFPGAYASASQLSVANPGGGIVPPEMYIELWWYSGATVSSTQLVSAYQVIQKGTTALNGNYMTLSSCWLHTLSSNWSANTKFALEVSLYAASGGTASAALIDSTSNLTVTSVSTTSTTATVLRSALVTLTPGHRYSVQLYTSNASYAAYLTDASLIVFPS